MLIIDLITSITMHHPIFAVGIYVYGLKYYGLGYSITFFFGESFWAFNAWGYLSINVVLILLIIFKKPRPKKMYISHMDIKPMTVRHIPAIAALERRCFSTPWSEAALTEELNNPLAVFRVAMAGDIVVGYTGMHHILEDGFITNVAVHPDCRRQRIGAALLDALIGYGREHDLSRLTLEVRESNKAAKALYEKTGFVQEGKRPDFYQHPAEDAMIYSLFL